MEPQVAPRENKMSLKKGDRVRHPTEVDWDLGEVLAVSGEEKVRVFFVGAGEKLLSLRHVTLDRVPEHEAAHPVLDNLRVPDKSGQKYQSLAQSVQKFLKEYPGGFHGERFLNEERKYKIDAHKLARDILSENELARLLAENQHEEVCRRALRVSNKTNLIFANEKIALNNGLESVANRQAFSSALFDLLYGEDDRKPSFERYADVLGGINAAKWTIATYFPFIVDPGQFIFLKPVATQKAAEISGYDISYRPELNWHTYEKALEFATYLKTELAELGPRDMIDVQSFMWCIVPGNG